MFNQLINPVFRNDFFGNSFVTFIDHIIGKYFKL
jgi:hypothetical protein